MNPVKKFKLHIHKKIYGKCREMKEMPPLTQYTLGDAEKLSLIYPVYVENKESLSKIFNNIKLYESYSPEILSNLNIIIVNDGSPLTIDWPQFNLNFSVLNIRENIKWNSGGAKNLGVCFAASERLLISDIDHTFPEETIDFCMKVREKDNILCFNQIEFYDDGRSENLHSPHPNIFFLSKSNYFYLNGYDEDFCGYYGDDIFFRKYLLHLFPNKVFIAPVDSYIHEFKEAFKLRRKLNCRRLLLLKRYNHSKDMLRFNFTLGTQFSYRCK